MRHQHPEQLRGKLSEWYVPPQIVTRKKVGCAARR